MQNRNLATQKIAQLNKIRYKKKENQIKFYEKLLELRAWPLDHYEDLESMIVDLR